MEHKKKKVFACNICGKSSFQGNNHLQNHIRIHTGEKPYKCELCDKAFNQRSILGRHINLMHKRKKQPFECDKCGKVYSDKYSYYCHIRVHKRIKTFKCKICSEVYSDKNNFNCHILVHKGENPEQMTAMDCKKKKVFACNICGKSSFQGNNHLQDHIRIHTGEKPYKCEYCGKAFNQRSILGRHINSLHNGKMQPFTSLKCDKCGKVCSDKYNFDYHIRVHNGEKPYKCKLCEKSFSGKGPLLRHIRKHSKLKLLKSEHCDKSFDQALDLNEDSVDSKVIGMTNEIVKSVSDIRIEEFVNCGETIKKEIKFEAGDYENDIEADRNELDPLRFTSLIVEGLDVSKVKVESSEIPIKLDVSGNDDKETTKDEYEVEKYEISEVTIEEKDIKVYI